MMRIQQRFRARAVTQRRASFTLFSVLPRTAPEGQGGSLLDATPVEITAQVFEWTTARSRASPEYNEPHGSSDEHKSHETV